MLASITAETTVYEPVETASVLEELGSSEIPVRSLFTVDLSFSPSLSTVGISPASALSKAAPKAKEQFVETVEDDGLIVEGTRDTLAFERPDGTEGRWYVLDVAYPIAPDLETERTRIAAETSLAIWPTEDSYGVAGGTLPLELPDRVADALGGSLDVDPDRDRETVTALIRATDAEDGGE